MNLKRTLLNKIRIIFSLCFLFGIFGFISREDSALEKLMAALQSWTQKFPVEKVYLHTDRPHYLVGDTIWFKAYVTTGPAHQLSRLSGALYVDLISESDSIAKSIKLPVTAGAAFGEFVLPDSSMREGNYRIRAYTRLMRNAGPAYFYDKTFAVGNSVVSSVYTRVKYEYSRIENEPSVTAVIGYDDDNGRPLVNKEVSYLLRAKAATFQKGSAKTDQNGEIKVLLKPLKGAKLKDSYLYTTIHPNDQERFIKTIPVKVMSLMPDFQFFPEGGSFVNGHRSRLAFKATGTDGLGIAVKGVVLDEQDQQLAEIQTQHAGMGYFVMIPQKGKKYRAKLSYPDGTESFVPLPVASDSGYSLSVYNQLDSMLIRIDAHPSLYQAGMQRLNLLVQSSGEVIYGTELNIGRPFVSLKVPIKDIRSGIVQVTLFSADNRPLNERICFVQNTDQMALKISSPKTVYSKREKIELDIAATAEKDQLLAGSFSAAVVNEDLLGLDETKNHTIFSHLLLSSDIKGYIEKPNYYFDQPGPETAAALDVLMMTQGYRRFLWKDVLNAQPTDAKFKKEEVTTTVSGRLMTLGNKPLAGGKVKLFNVKLNFYEDRVTDSAGRFSFDRLLLTEGIVMTLQGRTAKGGDKVEVLLDQVEDQQITPNFNLGDIDINIGRSLNKLLLNSKTQDKELERFGRLSRTQELREVVIRARKRTEAYGLGVIKGFSDQTLVTEEVKDYKTVLHALRARLRNISFNQINSQECGYIDAAFYGRTKLNAYVNGQRFSDCDFQALLEMKPDILDRIDVIRSPGGANAFLQGASIVITTKITGFNIRYNPAVLSFRPGGFTNAKLFYVPKYDVQDADPVTDLRTTIYWNPSVITDAAGKAKLSYFNNDNPGKYRVTVEGIGFDGRLGRQIYRYEVK